MVTVIATDRTEKPADTAQSMWKKLKPDFAYPVLRVQALPKDKGWEAIDQIVFDVPAQESKSFITIALQFQKKTYWLLIEASNALLSRRHAALW